MQHLIRKQIIALQLQAKLDAFRVQQQVSAHFWKEIMPAMEKVFDALSTNEEVIIVDRLELDLGILPVKSIEQNSWGDELQPVLLKQLEENLHSAATGGVISRRSQPLNTCAQWMYYIRNGFLPWNTLQPDAGWYDKVLEALATDYAAVQLLRNMLRTSVSAAKRISVQHSREFLISLTEILTARSQRDLPGTFDELYCLHNFINGQPGKPLPGKPFTNALWLKALVFSAAPLTGSSLSLQLIQSFLLENPVTRPLPAAVKEKLTTVLPIMREGHKTLPAKQKKRDIKQPAGPGAHPEEKEDDIFIIHAGMVLLHPFLNTFFNRLLLVAGNDFVDRACRQKALYLLHYLTTGTVGAMEYELVMAKVLCEWPLSDPVDRDIIISTGELEEADRLLAALIQQWDILKNTSSDGLREGFLQRSGKLIFRNGSNCLQIEPGSIDMLLDHLPWSLGMVKLPWMRNILRVEWR